MTSRFYAIFFSALAFVMSFTVSAEQINSTLFLNRITWGANASSAAQLEKMGMQAYLDQQLAAKSTVLPEAIQAQVAAMTISKIPFKDLIVTLAEQRQAAAKMKGTDDSLRKAYQQELTRIFREAQSRSLLRAIYSPNQLLEQMDSFWMNHFNISSRKENLRAMLGDFEETAIRPYALGNFRDLLGATLAHPAMLRYLDNEHNAAGKINENYARELLELHTMGVGSGYSQNDVQELARVLTGLRIQVRDNPRKRAKEGQANLVQFDAKRHDFDDKKILGQTIKGEGLAELDHILILLTRQPATAKFISRKLAMNFVSDYPSEALVELMAQSFLRSDGDITTVLKTMFATPEFIASLGQKFKDPRHYVISSLRLAYEGIEITNTGPILNWLNLLGQQANGHPTPDGYSMNEAAWASPAQMTARFDIAKLIARGTPNLFASEAASEEMQMQGKRDFPRPSLAQNAYVKKLSLTFNDKSQAAMTQATTPQEWNTTFLSTPEMMRR